MDIITDYIDLKSLVQLQQAFAAVAGCPIAICNPEGHPLVTTLQTLPAGSKYYAEAVIRHESQAVGKVRMYLNLEVDKSEKNVKSFRLKLLKFMANILGRFCRETTHRRGRINQIMALHKVIAEITTARHELQPLLDMITERVVDALGAKACAIRLLSPDGDSLRIRALHCINPQFLDTSPIPVSQSVLDQQTLAKNKTVYVADMTTDPRVKNQHIAKREGLASALCAPMIYKEKPLGVIRVYTAEPHEFDWFERQMLRTIASTAAFVIAEAQLWKKAQESWQMKRQLNMASVVQRRLIPQKVPKVDGFKIVPVYVPCQELSGDFYDFFELPEGNVGMTICDVVGKGVRASLLMATIRASLRAHASNVFEIMDVLGNVNSDLCAGTSASDFATMFYGVLNKENKQLTYCCAGHMPPLVVRNGEVIELESKGGVLGILPEMDFPKSVFDFQSGDIMLVYTDGLSEASNFEFAEYGIERIKKALCDAVEQGMSPAAIAKYCLWDMRRFAGLQKRQDDLTMLIVKAE